jgi:hypothetical protein
MYVCIYMDLELQRSSFTTQNTEVGKTTIIPRQKKSAIAAAAAALS